MSVTVSEFINRLAVDVHEDATLFPPGSHDLWTIEEIIGYLNTAEKDFIRRTGLFKQTFTISVGSGTQMVFDRPTGCFDIDRVSYQGKKLYRVTTWDLSREDPNWRTNTSGHPRYYYEDGLAVGKFAIDRRPSSSFELTVIGDMAPTDHTVSGYTTELIFVPDQWEQYIRWEVLSLMYGKDGDGQDVARSSYAHQRYLFGIGLATQFSLEHGA